MFEIALFHPKVVHFTIALFTVSVLLDLLGIVFKKEKFKIAGWYNLVLAGTAAIITVITGLLAEANVAHNDAAHEIMEKHETIGYMVLGFILVLLIWRIMLKGNFPQKLSVVYLGLALAGLGTMFTGAYYGGEMVYTHGVAVKAVPVTETVAGHNHFGEGEHSHEQSEGEHPEMHESAGETHEHNLQLEVDLNNPDTVKSQKNVHQHKGDSEHEHTH
jgi:uncharacterized membrane protein